jgi:RND family efflux transporter MFP subunit
MTLRARYGLATGVVLIAVAAIAIGVWKSGGRANPAPPPTVAVARGDVTSSVAASGTVQPVSTRELAFSMAGTLTAVNVKAGDTVATGQTLAAIDPSDARDALTQAQSTLSGAKQALTEAQAAAASPAPTRSGAPAQQQTKDTLYSAEVAVTKASQAVTKAQRVLTGTTLRAPIAGKVLSVAGKAGDSAGVATFIKLGVVENMMVKAEFAEADAVTLAVGQKALVQLGSRPGTDFPATIAQVAAVGTVTDRLVRYGVLLAFDQPPTDLLIGQSATAQVVINRAAGVLYLPQSAVLGTRVRLVDGAMKEVRTGLHGDGNVEITSGLAEGDLVRFNAR